MSQDDAERLLHYYRKHFMCYDADGGYLDAHRRQRAMTDQSITEAAREFAIREAHRETAAPLQHRVLYRISYWAGRIVGALRVRLR